MAAEKMLTGPAGDAASTAQHNNPDNDQQSGPPLLQQHLEIAQRKKVEVGEEEQYSDDDE